MKKTPPFYKLKVIFITSLSCLFTVLPNPASACGWWGDGEVNRHNDIVLTTPDGISVTQTLTEKTMKLPGRAGYGIAVPDPGRAIPYLQATRGQRVNRIAELKAFGFKTVIDLGTPEKTAQLHRSETEALGMHYINIPVDDTVPDQQQVDDFTQKVVDASNDLLLVYAPNSALLGTMWAAYRISLGAPVEFAMNQGRNLGMQPGQEAILRDQIEEKK